MDVCMITHSQPFVVFLGLHVSPGLLSMDRWRKVKNHKTFVFSYVTSYQRTNKLVVASMPFINTEVGLDRAGYVTAGVSNAAHPVIESLVGLCVSAADYVL